MLYGLLLVKLRQSFGKWQIIVLTARCYAERSIAMASCLYVLATARLLLIEDETSG